MAGNKNNSKTEKDTRDSAKNWQATFDAMTDAISLLDPEGRILQCNSSMQTLIGKPPEEIIGRHCYELVHDATGYIDGCPITRMKKTLHRETMVLPLADRWFNVAVDPLLDANGNLTGAVHIITDITELKRMEEDLRRELQTNTAMAVLASRLMSSGTIDELSYFVLEHARHLTGSPFGFVGHIDPQTGYLLSTTLTRDIWNICRVEDKSIIFKEFRGLWGWVLNNRQSLLTNSPEEDTRSSGIPPGHIPIRRFLSAPALIDGTLGGQIALANADQDYTERDQKVVERLADLFAIAIQHKQSEKTLQNSEERFRRMAENIPDGLTIIENDQIVYLNDRTCEIFGYPREELLKLTAYDLAAPEEKERLRLVMEESRLIKQPFREVEFWIVHKDGTRRFIRNRYSYNYKNDEIVGRYIVTTDITEHKKAEELLRQSEERT